MANAQRDDQNEGRRSVCSAPPPAAVALQAALGALTVLHGAPGRLHNLGVPSSPPVRTLPLLCQLPESLFLLIFLRSQFKVSVCKLSAKNCKSGTVLAHFFSNPLQTYSKCHSLPGHHSLIQINGPGWAVWPRKRGNAYKVGGGLRQQYKWVRFPTRGLQGLAFFSPAEAGLFYDLRFTTSTIEF